MEDVRLVEAAVEDAAAEAAAAEAAAAAEEDFLIEGEEAPASAVEVSSETGSR